MTRWPFSLSSPLWIGKASLALIFKAKSIYSAVLTQATLIGMATTRTWSSIGCSESPG